MHPVEEYQDYNLDRGQVEWVWNCDAHKKKVGVELLYNSVHRKFNPLGIRPVRRSDELEIRCGRENQHPEMLGPRAPIWAAQENRKEMWLWPIESICCSSVRSPTASHTQPFQIKWEVYFSKNCVVRLYCVVIMILHASAYEYTTHLTSHAFLKIGFEINEFAKWKYSLNLLMSQYIIFFYVLFFKPIVGFYCHTEAILRTIFASASHQTGLDTRSNDPKIRL